MPGKKLRHNEMGNVFISPIRQVRCYCALELSALASLSSSQGKRDLLDGIEVQNTPNITLACTRI